MKSKKKLPTNKSQKITKPIPIHTKPIPIETNAPINYTYQIRNPTFNSCRLKNIVRSMDSINLPLTNPYRKSTQRKTTCKTAKPNLVYQPPKLTQMMQQFKLLQIIHQISRPNSKTPAFCKSVQLDKVLPKKVASKTLKKNAASDTTLAVKREKCNIKLNQSYIIKEQDSIFPMMTSSDIVSDIKQNQCLIIEDDEIANQSQLQLRQTGSMLHHKDKRVLISFTYQQVAARKIQRTWRRFHTTKLVKEQLKKNGRTGQNPPLLMIQAGKTDKNKQMMFRQQLYQRDKLLILNSINKRSLKRQQKITRNQDEQMKKQQLSNMSESSSSHAIHQYNTKKYIQYFDGDIFPSQESASKLQSISSEHVFRTPNFKTKQQVLLPQPIAIPIELGSSLYQTQSLKNLKLVSANKDVRSSSRVELKKSKSEKIMQKLLLEVEQISFDEYYGKINLELLTIQYLEGADPNNYNPGLVYQQRHENVLEQLKTNNENSHILQQNILQELVQNNQDSQPILAQASQLVLSSNSSKLHLQQPLAHEINIQQSPSSPRIHISIDSEGEEQEEMKPVPDQQMDKEQQNQKSDMIAAIIQNNLIMQILRQAAESDTIFDSFKTHSLAMKSRVIRGQQTKKKGFATSQQQISRFIENLLKFIEQQQPNIFINLEIPTGPSPIQILRYLHQFDEQNEQQIEQQQDESKSMVIPNRLFNAFWRVRQKSIVVELPQNQDQINSAFQIDQFKNLNKIFYLSLFHTFNECLEYQRKYGLYGQPFPWKRVPTFVHQNNDKTEIRLKNAQRRMLKLSTTYCGLIVQKEQMGCYSQQNIDYLRQDRLVRMLSSHVIEAEGRWFFYDDQQLEILVEITNYIYSQLINEVQEHLEWIY